MRCFPEWLPHLCLRWPSALYLANSFYWFVRDNPAFFVYKYCFITPYKGIYLTCSWRGVQFHRSRFQPPPLVTQCQWQNAKGVGLKIRNGTGPWSALTKVTCLLFYLVVVFLSQLQMIPQSFSELLFVSLLQRVSVSLSLSWLEPIYPHYLP